MDDTKSKSNTINTPASIIIAGLIIAGAILWTNGSSIDTQKNVQNTGQAALPTPTVTDIEKVTTAGKPFIGNPNAPVTVAYWSDYQCPFCRQHEINSIPKLVQDYIDTGKVKLIIKDFQFLGPDSHTLGKFSRAVWSVAPAKYYEWHRGVFENQGTENSGWATQSKIISITKSILGDDDTEKVVDLVARSGAIYQKEIDDDKKEGASLGVTGTPAMIIGKKLISGAVPYDQIKAAIEEELAKK